MIFLDTYEEQTDRTHHELVSISGEAVTFSSQQMAGCSWIICMQQHAHTPNTQSHTDAQTHNAQTHTQQGPAEYIVSLQRTEGFPALL